MRCTTCGNGDDDGAQYRRVKEYKGVMLCRPCRLGTQALEKEDGWFQDPETLEWINPNPNPEMDRVRGQVTELAFRLSGRGMTVVNVHPTSFVAVDAIDGFRLHLYLDNTARLFTDGLASVPLSPDGATVMTLAPGAAHTDAVYDFLMSDALTDIKDDFRRNN